MQVTGYLHTCAKRLRYVACCIRLPGKHICVAAVRTSYKLWSNKGTCYSCCLQTLFLMPNVLNLARPCSWFIATMHWVCWGRWTCWNSLATLWCIQAHDLFPVDGSPGFCNWMLGMRWRGRVVNKQASAEGRTLIIDLPIWVHLPKVSYQISQESLPHLHNHQQGHSGACSQARMRTSTLRRQCTGARMRAHAQRQR
jgi:hypothetical protein